MVKKDEEFANLSHVDNDTDHLLWIDSKSPISINLADLKSQQVSPTLYRLSGTVADVQMSNPRNVLTAQRNAQVTQLVASVNDHPPILQKVVNAPMSQLQLDKLEQALDDNDFVGGQNNAPALADALKQLEPYQNAELLWVYGPQPVVFDKSSAALEQVTQRLSRFPKIALFGVTDGPNKLLENTSWALSPHNILRIIQLKVTCNVI